MTKWFHTCDLEWMKARQRVLTATDIKELLPVTKTGRKRTVDDENYFKVIVKKLVNIALDDCKSTGAAARGHILEPYAIDRYNEIDYGSNIWLHHWDDVVVTRSGADAFSLAFSPDAMDIGYDKSMIPMVSEVEPNVIGEVKSYSAERHLSCGYAPKQQLEERWQIATAMAVKESIREAYLLFYNPSMSKQLFIVDYDRQDLASEIDIILEVEEKWLDWVKKFDHKESYFCVLGGKNEELQIVRNIMDSEKMNPEGERSVLL
jgi:hypothetical protein